MPEPGRGDDRRVCQAQAAAALSPETLWHPVNCPSCPLALEPHHAAARYPVAVYVEGGDGGQQWFAALAAEAATVENAALTPDFHNVAGEEIFGPAAGALDPQNHTSAGGVADCLNWFLHSNKIGTNA